MARAARRTDDLSRVRTFTRWSLIAIVAVTVVLPAVEIAAEDRDAVLRIAVLLVLVAAGVEQVRLVLGAMGGVDPRDLLRPGLVVVPVATLAVLALTACDPSSDALGFAALPYAGVLAAAVLWLPPSRRWWLVAGGGALGAVVGGTAAAVGGAGVLPAALIPPFVVACMAFAVVLQMWIWDVTLRLDEARASAAELAVLRERLRFAADLHDVQGHHLQAIALKAELARRLVGTDDDGARRHAADVQELTLAALADTRALVHGYRRVGLVQELENAVGILRAAGVEASVSGTPEQVPEALQPLFGSLVREGATNLLRHTQAARCTLTVETDGPDVVLRVEDDGTARATPGPREDPGTGVVALRERFVAVGGRVDAGPRPTGGFALTGRAPR